MRATFRAKLMGIVGVAALGFVVLITASTGIGAQIEQQLLLIRDHHVPRLELGPRLNTQFERVRRALQDAVAAQDKDALAATRVLRDQFLRQLSGAHGPNQASVHELREAFEEYFEAAHDVSRRLILGESGEGLVETIATMQAKQLTATDALRRATSVDQSELSTAFTAVSQAERAGARIQLAFGLASFALVLLLSLWLSHGLLRTVTALSTGFERFGKGQLSEPITVRARDELGMLAERANAMALSLARLQEERDRADWIRTGQTRLMNELQGERSPTELAGRALRFLAEYLQLPAAAFYRAGLDGSLHALSHFGLDSPAATRGELRSFQRGEGLIGRAAAQTELLLIDDVPTSYLRIRSGLGESQPSVLALLPLVHAGRVTGVLELACWKPWSSLQSELLGAVRESLAVAIEVSTAGETQRELLAETQRQARRLAAQEEEVRKANDELQAQQEELRHANGELRQQAIELERRQAELERKNGELNDARSGLQEKADQLTAISTYKSQFLANMSHELRTPLNSMLLLSSLLAENENGNLTAKQVEFCNTVHGAGKDLLGLINQVLDLAKIESGKQDVRIETFAPSVLLQSAERIVGPLARDKGLEFVAQLSPDLPAKISTDRHKLEQILNNLLGNAIKFTERGSVSLRVGLAPADAQIERDDLKAARALAITVSDTGIGIAPEHLRNVFAPFEQVDARPNRRYGGTGLGLTIARELSALLGGELQLQSTSGQGSTFVCYLPSEYPAASAAVRSNPLATAATPPTTKPVAAGPRAGRHQPLTATNGTVLVIEDDPAFAETVCQSVQSQGFASLHARDGETGLRLAKELVPGGIILDVCLPDVDGFEVMELLQADPITARIPVHFVSAIDGGERGIALGAIGYLTKPASRQDLVRVVQSLAHGPTNSVCRVLIIEDDAHEADLLVRRLDGAGVEIHHAATAEDALRLLEKLRFQCIVLDLGLPDTDGLKLLQSLQERSGGEPPSIVVYTGRTLSRAEMQRLEAYADSVVIKGVGGGERVLDRVRAFAQRLQDGSPVKPKLALGPPLRLDGLKVLLVDDDMRTVYALSALLRAKGANVQVADTGRAALLELDAHPDVEIVLMDIMMPEMDGYEAMRQIRKDARFQSLPIVALTAKAMKGDSDRCLESGATDYLPKPIDPDRLVSLLRSARRAG